MPKIDNLTIQKIKDAASIVDVMSDFIELKPKGQRYLAICPFHDDHRLGSFSIYPKANCYKCFACDAKGGPIEFLMQYKGLSYHDALLYLAQKYGIYVEDNTKVFENVKPAKPKELTTIEDNLPKRLWPAAWVGYYKNLNNDNFVHWLREQRWDAAQMARMNDVLNDYHVGHVWFSTRYGGVEEKHDFTVWWMLDEKNQLHNGHFMKYLPNGHRDKTSEYNQTWLHARMKYAKGDNFFDETKTQPSYCLFGQHLLNAYPTATVNIVESEKTAVIMATAYGNHSQQVWMACAGLQNLKRERLQPLIDQGRKIQLFPDRDGIGQWLKKASEINYRNIMLNTTAVKEWWLPQDGDKADIADIIIRIINEGR